MRLKLAGNWIKSSLKSAIAALTLASASLAGAQTIQTLCSFSNSDHSQPAAALTLGSDGDFYGTTYETDGGRASYGTVFKVTTNGTLTTLVSFNRANGAIPHAGLTLGNDGSFYGTTVSGGKLTLNDGFGYGTVFKVTTSGTLTTLVSFSGTNGAYPEAALTLGNDGNLYGTTYNFGGGYGTVFKVTTNGTLTTLTVFNYADGANPLAALTLGNDGCFYGTTTSGGSGNCGTLFKVTTSGTLTKLVDFANENVRAPHAALTLGNDGNFYGTTYEIDGGYATVFKVTTNGTLHILTAFNYAKGADPLPALTLGNDGCFYGTTTYGGSGNYGMVFRVTTRGTLTTLASFDSTNGANPWAGLTLGNDGNFYGTTTRGGSYGNGIVFRLLVPPVFEANKNYALMGAGAVVVVGLIVSFYRYQRRKGPAVGIALSCSKCGQHIVIDEAGAGLQVECPACGAALVVPHTQAGQTRVPQVMQPPRIPPPLLSFVPPPNTAGIKTADTKKCPFCAEMIRVEAIKCKHCGSMLNKPTAVIQQTDAKPGELSPGE